MDEIELRNTTNDLDQIVSDWIRRTYGANSTQMNAYSRDWNRRGWRGRAALVVDWMERKEQYEKWAKRG